MKKKAYLSMLGLLLLGSVAEAQISQGSHLISGNVGLTSQHMKITYAGDSESGSVSFLDLEGSYTYMKSDRLGFGARMVYSRIGGGSYRDKVSISTIAIIPSVRYYVYQRDRFHTYVNAGVGFGQFASAGFDNRVTNGFFTLGSAIGFQHFITEQIGWGVQINADYVSSKNSLNYVELRLGIGFTFNLRKQ